MFDNFFHEFFRDPAEEQDRIDRMNGLNYTGILIAVVGTIAVVLPQLI